MSLGRRVFEQRAWRETWARGGLPGGLVVLDTALDVEVGEDAVEQVKFDQAEADRCLGTPMRAVFARGIESGLFRQDISVDVLLALFGGALMSAVKLMQTRQLGLEEASAATAAVFLDGARAR